VRVQAIVSVELLFATTGALAYYYWPRSLTPTTPPIQQTISYTGGRTVVAWNDRVLVGKLGEFGDALSAYLMFDYVRSHPRLRDKKVLLTSNSCSGGPQYSIWVELPHDMLTGLDELALIKENHLTSIGRYAWITTNQYSHDLDSTSRFIEAFNSPDSPRLEEIPSSELQRYVRQFICFKASVDPRTWEGDRGPLVRPGIEEAEALAEDIVEVARFYNLPVDVLLGIGAMENNFLDAPGDLNNAIWKKHVEPDDIVLRRRGREALVLNSSMGTWQITRRSLRYAQKLFLCDTRDYSKISCELRPTEHLDMNFLSPHVLTTYAALLLRNLVDYFEGDVFLATAAYNGTKVHPNLDYALGVENVASYARRVIGNTAKLNQQVGGKAGTPAEINAGLTRP